MKRVSYIVFGVVFLALASCQKEVIMPNDPARNASDIEWESTGKEGSKSGSNDKALDTNPNNSGIDDAADSGTDDGSANDGGITDPNNDPDAAKKKGKK